MSKKSAAGIGVPHHDEERLRAPNNGPYGHDPSALQLARVLTHLALGAWAVSLLLPGFVVQSQAQAWYGWAILVMGLLFGWAVNGWAVYANLLFPYVVIQLNLRKAAPVAVWLMMGVAATIIFFRGVIRDEGSGTILPVVSWGLGAVLWLISLILAAIGSMIYAGALRRRSAVTTLVALGVCSVALGMTHVVQRFLANDQERQIYLSRGMVFTTAEFCGVPFVWPEKPMIPYGQMVKVHVADARSARTGPPYLLLPRFSNFQDGNFQWRIYRDPVVSSVQVKVRAMSPPARYVLQAQPTDKGAVIRLVDSATQKTLYEQRLRTVSWFSYKTYCPYAAGQWEGLTRGYDTAALRAVGQEPTITARPPMLTAQIARLPCSLGSGDVDGVDGLRMWDQRLVILDPPSVRSRIGFCSDTYIALVYVSMRSAEPTDLSPVVQVFDRKTMEPIASFNDGRPCLHGRCDEAPKAIVKGVRIDNDSVVVETERGNLQANRLPHRR